MVSKSKETGQILDEYLPGMFVTEWNDRLVEVTAVEETVVFCFTPELNRGYIPETTPVVLNANNTTTYDAGTRFFLCQGTVEINDVEFTGPCQIGFKNTQSLKTKTDIYGIIIE